MPYYLSSQSSCQQPHGETALIKVSKRSSTVLGLYTLQHVTLAAQSDMDVYSLPFEYILFATACRVCWTAPLLMGADNPGYKVSVLGGARHTGADLTAVVREAALAALQEDMGARAVAARHFHAALAEVAPSTAPTAAALDMYARFERQGAL